jgi:hypothetical protein
MLRLSPTEENTYYPFCGMYSEIGQIVFQRNTYFLPPRATQDVTAWDAARDPATSELHHGARAAATSELHHGARAAAASELHHGARDAASELHHAAITPVDAGPLRCFSGASTPLVRRPTRHDPSPKRFGRSPFLDHEANETENR